MNILVAPAAYRTGLEHSDSEVSYQILMGLKRNEDFRITMISNFVPTKLLKKEITVRELNVNLDGSLLEQLIYQTRLLIETQKLAQEMKPEIIHHLAPFYVGAGFNTFAAMRKLKSKFVIGPVMYNVLNSHHPSLFEDTMRTRWGRMNETLPFSAYMRERFLNQIISPLGPFRRSLSKRTMEKADALIAINKFTFDACLNFVPPEKVHIIPLGVDTSKFAFSELPDNQQLICFGPLQQRRGIQHLIRAMSLVVRDFPCAQLTVTGAGPLRAYLEALSVKLGLTKNVHFTGFVKRADLIDLLKRSRVLCHPSCHETFGISMLEGMSAGRPVVAFETVGSREIVRNDETGYLIRIGDVEELAKRICNLLEDHGQARKMGLRGRETALNKYDWRIISAQYSQVYRKIVA
jgi:glycosyltransferase involved in cell wall biosynthesis